MAKVVLGSLSGGYGHLDTLNDNFSRLATALENTLSRDGTSPNAMGATLDMNSNRIINLAAPVSGSDAARLDDVQGVINSGLPTQTGLVNYVLKTDGTDASWTNILKMGDGTKAAPAYTFNADATTGFYRAASGKVGFAAGGKEKIRFETRLDLSSDLPLAWGSSDDLAVASLDLFVYRDAANVLALKSGLNPQKFRVYNTATDPSNYERVSIGWQSNQFDIIGEKAGTGLTRRMRIMADQDLILGQGGQERWWVDGSGHFKSADGDNLHDIGASVANRPRTVHAATSVVVGANTSLLASGVTTQNISSNAPGGSVSIYGGQLGVDAVEQFRVAYTASAVNYVRVTGGAVGVSPTISAQGSDSNTNIVVQGKGLGTLLTTVANGTYTQVVTASVPSAASGAGGLGIYASDGNLLGYFRRAGGIGELLQMQAVHSSITQMNIGGGATGTLSQGIQFQTNSAVTQFAITHTASAVNYIYVTGQATTGYPAMAATGSDANVGMNFGTKGVGYYDFWTNNFAQRQFRITHTNNAVNYTYTTGAAASGYPIFGVDGSDTNIGLYLISKGTGEIRFTTSGGLYNQVFVKDTVSAVNVMCLTGSATGNAVRLFTEGTDGNIDISLEPKGAGVVRFPGGVSLTGGQLKFPATQNPSSDVNTLDDYEEGTFTPNVGGTATYTTQTGVYTKIGRVVHVAITLVINAIGTGNTSNIFGLPFTAGGTGQNQFTTRIFGASTSIVSVVGVNNGGTTTIGLVTRTAASASDSQIAVMTSGTTVYISGTYYV